MLSLTQTLLLLLPALPLAAAHGHVTGIISNRVFIPGFTLNQIYNPPIPNSIGWSTTATDNGFETTTSSNMACHRGSSPGQLHATVAAGSTLTLQWDPNQSWPHPGAVMDYLAPCSSSGCATANPSTLEFFKISQKGRAGSIWAANKVTNNGNQWSVKIPSGVRSGYYVLRHEILALHSPGSPQHYPQCINLKITGGGSGSYSGTRATDLYETSDAGITYNIYTSSGGYPFPGPGVISGGGAVGQGRVTPTATQMGSVLKARETGRVHARDIEFV